MAVWTRTWIRSIMKWMEWRQHRLQISFFLWRNEWIRLKAFCACRAVFLQFFFLILVISFRFVCSNFCCYSSFRLKWKFTCIVDVIYTRMGWAFKEENYTLISLRLFRYLDFSHRKYQFQFRFCFWFIYKSEIWNSCGQSNLGCPLMQYLITQTDCECKPSAICIGLSNHPFRGMIWHICRLTIVRGLDNLSWYGRRKAACK